MFQKSKEYVANLLPFKPNKNNKQEIIDEVSKEKIKEKMLIYQNHKDNNDLKVLQQIYDEVYKYNHIDQNQKRFIKSIESNSQLFSYYSIKQLQEKHKMLKLCSKFREVRGDGNCFYTALGFRFLQILLGEQNQSQFLSFLDKIELIDLQFIQYFKNQKIPEEIQKSLLNEYLFRLCQMRLIEDQEQRLINLVEQYKAFEPKDDIDGYFFALTTIFFRNISYYVASKSELAENIFDKDNLLIWGEECNNNEIIIKELAEFLRVMIVLVFINKGTVQSVEYSGELHYHQILLLFQPGHYNIGFE
ncbi:unnamed protein product [Paramecium pentaurelia]|uniref:OTU domain-containing protein n=1 Tax=Paramecium pentaurelia TaxID=43138 RepID=A0A8S1YD37_9CILI|nr:unnamed protein product [Paramecium pentaurelia]